MATKDQSHSGERTDAKRRSRYTPAQGAHAPERATSPGQPVRQPGIARNLFAPGDIIRLQRTLGNRHVSKLLAGSAPQSGGPVSNPAGTRQAPGTIQRYLEYSVENQQAGQATDAWQNPQGGAMKVAEDFTIAVDDSQYTRHAWATEAQIDRANEVLHAQGSPLILTRGAPLDGNPPGQDEKAASLHAIKPQQATEYSWWKDDIKLANECGQACLHLQGLTQDDRFKALNRDQGGNETSTKPEIYSKFVNAAHTKVKPIPKEYPDEEFSPAPSFEEAHQDVENPEIVEKPLSPGRQKSNQEQFDSDSAEDWGNFTFHLPSFDEIGKKGHSEEEKPQQFSFHFPSTEKAAEKDTEELEKEMSEEESLSTFSWRFPSTVPESNTTSVTSMPVEEQPGEDMFNRGRSQTESFDLFSSGRRKKLRESKETSVSPSQTTPFSNLAKRWKRKQPAKPNISTPIPDIEEPTGALLSPERGQDRVTEDFGLDLFGRSPEQKQEFGLDLFGRSPERKQDVVAEEFNLDMFRPAPEQGQDAVAEEFGPDMSRDEVFEFEEQIPNPEEKQAIPEIDQEQQAEVIENEDVYINALFSGTIFTFDQKDVITTPDLWSENILRRAMLGAIGEKAKSRKEAMAWYDSLFDKDAVDKSYGINKYAVPKLGESLTINAEKQMPGFTKDSNAKAGFNFHFATAIMTAGQDYLTLENDTDKDTTQHFYFNLFGPASKDQSFHQQYGKSGEFGNKYTTMVVVRGDRDVPAEIIGGPRVLLQKGTRIQVVSEDAQQSQVKIISGLYKDQIMLIANELIAPNKQAVAQPEQTDF